MYPNLLGQKEYRGLSNEDLARVLNVTRQGFEKKLKSGRFTPTECMALCNYFGKSFEYLFALDGDKLAS